MGRKAVPAPGEFARAVAKDIEWELLQAGYSQRAFAPLVDMSHSYLGDRIKNQYPFTIEDADRIYTKLGIRPGERLAAIEQRFIGGTVTRLFPRDAAPVGGSVDAMPIDEPYAANTDASHLSEEDQDTP